MSMNGQGWAIVRSVPKIAVSKFYYTLTDCQLVLANMLAVSCHRIFNGFNYNQ